MSQHQQRHIDLTLADIVAVCSISFIFCWHHDVPGCHPCLCLQAKSLHATAETNIDFVATVSAETQGGYHRELSGLQVCVLEEMNLVYAATQSVKVYPTPMCYFNAVQKEGKQKCEIIFETNKFY